MQINLCFPTVIGFSDCPFIDEIKEPYKKIISDYKYEANGRCDENIHLKPKFSRLNNWIMSELDKYVEGHLYKDKYECTESWLIDYKLGIYQPIHNHPGFVFSVLFFLEGYEDDVNLTFHHPVDDMMNPLNNTAKQQGETNNFTHREVYYKPKTGRLIIWRSNIMHSVLPKTKNCKRIILSYNFNKK